MSDASGVLSFDYVRETNEANLNGLQLVATRRGAGAPRRSDRSEFDLVVEVAEDEPGVDGGERDPVSGSARGTDRLAQQVVQQPEQAHHGPAGAVDPDRLAVHGLVQAGLGGADLGADALRLQAHLLDCLLE
jgi:hypothetical protein